MDVASLLVDGYQRIGQVVGRVLDDMPDGLLVAQPEPGSNTIAWLVWHLARVQDDHVADAFGLDQLWTAQGWAQRFGMPFAARDVGFGHGAEQVRAVPADAELLLGYHEAVQARTLDLLAALDPAALDRVVDTRWDPPVTLGVRLVSVLADDLQHAGQAAYLRGMLERGSGQSWSAV